MSDAVVSMKYLKFLQEKQKAYEVQMQVIGHFRFRIRECLKTLSTEDFNKLCYTCLNEVHFPLMSMYLDKLDEEKISSRYSPTKKKRLLYFIAALRRILEVQLTELGEYDYDPILVEFLISNNFWGN